MDPKSAPKFRPQVERLDKKMSSQSHCDEPSLVDSGVCTMESMSFQDMGDQTVVAAAAEQQVEVIVEGGSAMEDAGLVSQVCDMRLDEAPAPGLFAGVILHAKEHPSSLRPSDFEEASREETTAEDRTDADASGGGGISAGAYEENTHMHNYACCGDSTYLLAPFRAALADTNEDGDTSLHVAVIHGQVPVVEQIATVWQHQSQYLNVQNNLGQTGLHLAILTNQPRIVERLLTAGADPCKRDRHGDTCLHLAARRGDKTSSGIVLSACQRFNLRKPMLEARNYAGLTAVHVCVEHNRRDMLKELVTTWGADVDAQEFTAGRSPLHLAVEAERLGIASILVFDLQANVDALTFDNHTPLHVAAGRGHRGMVALLVAAGARTDLADGEGEQAADLTYDSQILRLCNA